MNIPRKNLFGKLNTPLFRALESATAYAKLKGHRRVEVAHWLWHFWQLPGTDLQLLAAHHRLDAGSIDQELREASERQPVDPDGLIDFGAQVLATVEKAWAQSSLGHGESAIRSAWMLEALIEHAELRRELKAASPTLLKISPPLHAMAWQEALQHSVEGKEGAYDQTDLVRSEPGEASGALPSDPAAHDALARYCTDLTSEARNGRIDPVIGRDHDIKAMIDVLLRRRQNNPLLTGEAGVGKTAVVEGLALAVAQGRVPPALRDVRLLSLDVGALVAGASMRGEFESRLKQLLREIQACERPVILFIDEIHTLVGAGGQTGTGDAANLLKPALARGGLRAIGATTWSEFKKHIEKDPALTRRFQMLQIHEPTPQAAKSMLRSLVGSFARHHGVFIAEEAVDAAVDLSHRYLPARQLPDKAISLLDTACARTAMSLHAEPPELVTARARLGEVVTQRDLCRSESLRSPALRPRLDLLEQNELELRLELARHEDRWSRERSLVEALTKEWRQASPDAPLHEEGAAEQQRLREELHALQGDTPLVHPDVDADVVAAVLADWTGIPAGRMLADEKQAARDLSATLGRRIKGQAHALEVIAQRVQVAKAGLGDPDRPVGVFLLAGPSGVGKTETALALAEAVYGGEHNLITLNMSEFQESHTVSSLKGSPPGYVGYGEGGVLTEAVRRRPYSVVLLDEIDKAHPDVHEVFYQVFDKGWMEDGEGRQIDFRNVLVLLTTNCGAELIEQLCSDDALLPDMHGLATALQPELRRVFPAAFLGRMSVVPYLPLSAAVVEQVVELQLAKVTDRMQRQHHIELRFSDEARARVAQAAGAMEIGARRIAQHIDNQILPVLAAHWLQSMPEPAPAAEPWHLRWGPGTGYRLEPDSGRPPEPVPIPRPSMD